MNNLKSRLRPTLLTKDDKADVLAVPLMTGSLGLIVVVEALQREGLEFRTATAVDIITR
ncbi:DNA-binding domain-containing protein, partial [Ornithobacterium rhinotracheale]